MRRFEKAKISSVSFIEEEILDNAAVLQDIVEREVRDLRVQIGDGIYLSRRVAIGGSRPGADGARMTVVVEYVRVTND